MELEAVSRETRLKFTRLMRFHCDAREQTVVLIKQNRFINIANAVLGRPAYRLESDDWGEYESAEYGWHIGELELIMRLATTLDLVEILADYIQNRLFSAVEVNDILQEDRSSFTFDLRSSGDEEEVTIDIVSIAELEEGGLDGDHPNIRLLADRMNRALDTRDPAAVLHAAASIFETLAKDILADPAIQDKSLGGFFEKYKNASKLPDAVLDYVRDIFRDRSVVPLAGHGNTQTPSITMDEAVVLNEMTRAFVRIERRLQQQQISAKKAGAGK